MHAGSWRTGEHRAAARVRARLSKPRQLARSVRQARTRTDPRAAASGPGLLTVRYQQGQPTGPQCAVQARLALLAADRLQYAARGSPWRLRGGKVVSAQYPRNHLPANLNARSDHLRCSDQAPTTTPSSSAPFCHPPRSLPLLICCPCTTQPPYGILGLVATSILILIVAPHNTLIEVVEGAACQDDARAGCIEEASGL